MLKATCFNIWALTYLLILIMQDASFLLIPASPQKSFHRPGHLSSGRTAIAVTSLFSMIRYSSTNCSLPLSARFICFPLERDYVDPQLRQACALLYACVKPQQIPREEYKYSPSYKLTLFTASPFTSRTMSAGNPNRHARPRNMSRSRSRLNSKSRRKRSQNGRDSPSPSPSARDTTTEYGDGIGATAPKGAKKGSKANDGLIHNPTGPLHLSSAVGTSTTQDRQQTDHWSLQSA